MRTFQRLTVVAAFTVGLLMLVPHHSVDAQGGQIVVSTTAEVTGTNAAVQIAASGTARWVQVIALSTNGAVIRCGDSNVSSSRGLPIAAGGGFMFPPMPVDSRQAISQHYYSLAALYCYVSTGDKVDLAWGN